MVNRYDEPLGTETILKPVGPESDQGRGGRKAIVRYYSVMLSTQRIDSSAHQFLRVTAGLRYHFLKDWPAQARLLVFGAWRLVWSAPGSEGPQATVPLFWKGRSFGTRASLI